MDFPSIFKTNRSNKFLIPARSGFLKPILAIILFFGLGMGLIFLSQHLISNKMISYQAFKKGKDPFSKNLKVIDAHPSSQPPKTFFKNRIKNALDKLPKKQRLPRKTLELIQKGMALSENGKFNLADFEFELASQMSPNSPEVQAIWATSLRMAKRYKGADKHFAKANELAPNDEEILLNWGMSKLMDGNDDGAIVLLKKSIAINPDNALVHNYLGKAYGRKKDYTAEEASYRKALELQPDFAQAHFNLAVVLSLAKKFDLATEHFKQAIKLDEQFNKPFVGRFLNQYEKVKEIQESIKPENPLNVPQSRKSISDNPGIKTSNVEGSKHDGEGSSGKVEKEFTYVRGTIKVNGKPFRKNAVVFLETKDKLKVPGQKRLSLKILQKNLQFTPRHTIASIGSKIIFVNDDNEIHNIYSKSLNNQFNLGVIPTGTSKAITLEDAGPIVLRCNVHKNMIGTIFVAPNGYYTETGDDGNFEFENVKSKEYFLQVWHPQLYPEEIEATLKSIGLTGKDAIYNFDFQSKSKPEEIHDIVETTDYDAIVTKIEKLLYNAISSWDKGKKYKPRNQILIAITKHYDGEGLKGAIAKSFSEKRSTKLEEKIDAIRKKLSGIDKSELVTVKSLKNQAAFVISQLRLNVRELKARVKPD